MTDKTPEEIGQDIAMKHKSDRTWLSKDVTDVIREAEARGERRGLEKAAAVAERLSKFRKGVDGEADLLNAGNMIAANCILSSIRALMEETK